MERSILISLSCYIIERCQDSNYSKPSGVVTSWHFKGKNINLQKAHSERKVALLLEHLLAMVLQLLLLSHLVELVGINVVGHLAHFMQIGVQVEST